MAPNEVKVLTSTRSLSTAKYPRKLPIKRIALLAMSVYYARRSNSRLGPAVPLLGAEVVAASMVYAWMRGHRWWGAPQIVSNSRVVSSVCTEPVTLVCMDLAAWPPVGAWLAPRAVRWRSYAVARRWRHDNLQACSYATRR